MVHVGAVLMCDLGRRVEVRWFMAFKFEVKGFWHGLCVFLQIMFIIRQGLVV